MRQKMVPTSRLLTLLLALALCASNTYAYVGDLTPDTTAAPAGPLTTPFTAPTSCFQVTTRYPYGYPGLEVACAEGANKDCCPDNWGPAVYYSPGMCPSGYNAYPLPTSKQRQETTNYCCPGGYSLIAQTFCYSQLATPVTMTYSDETRSTRRTQDYVKATPIQVRFKASESDIVPVPAGSLSLPRDWLYTREKVGIAFGVAGGVGLITGAIYYWFFVRRRRNAAQAESMQPLNTAYGNQSSEDAPPPYPGRTDMNTKR